MRSISSEALLQSEFIVFPASEERRLQHDRMWPIEPVAAMILTCAWLAREIVSSSTLQKRHSTTPHEIVGSKKWLWSDHVFASTQD